MFSQVAVTGYLIFLGILVLANIVLDIRSRRRARLKDMALLARAVKLTCERPQKIMEEEGHYAKSGHTATAIAAWADFFYSVTRGNDSYTSTAVETFLSLGIGEHIYHCRKHEGVWRVTVFEAVRESPVD